MSRNTVNPIHNLDPHRHMIVVRHPDALRERRLAIGYWSSFSKGKDMTSFLVSAFEMFAKGPLPHPSNFVDEKWDKGERDMVVEYLTSFDSLPMLSVKNLDDVRTAWGLDPVKGAGPRVIHKWMGYAPCRMCDKLDNGTRCIGDDKFIWPEGFAHYIEEHGVRPPREFIDHVKEMVEKNADQ